MWAKKIIRVWDRPDSLGLSVVFTWDLPKARAVALQETQREVVVGGPAVKLMPEYVAQWATVATREEPSALQLHNPDATRSTIGCKRGCSFCGVAKIEGEFRELDDYRVAPILCDSNFLQSSRRHFDRVIDALKPLHGVDFNQGLDARLLNRYHARRLAELDMGKIRLAWDSAACEKPVLDAIELLRMVGFPKSLISVYCLVNAGETQEEATYRLQTLKGLGYRGFPMRYRPLDALAKDAHIDPQWQNPPNELNKFLWYWSRQRYLGGVQYEKCSWTVRSNRGQGQMEI